MYTRRQNRKQDEKERFYEEVERIYSNCPKNDIKIILGDLNVKRRKENDHRGECENSSADR